MPSLLEEKGLHNETRGKGLSSMFCRNVTARFISLKVEKRIKRRSKSGKLQQCTDVLLVLKHGFFLR
jgi:hypothetical protein